MFEPRFPKILKPFKKTILSDEHFWVKENNLPKLKGWRGFLTMIRNLFQCNRAAKTTNTKFIIEVKFPLKWFK